MSYSPNKIFYDSEFDSSPNYSNVGSSKVMYEGITSHFNILESMLEGSQLEFKDKYSELSDMIDGFSLNLSKFDSLKLKAAKNETSKVILSISSYATEVPSEEELMKIVKSLSNLKTNFLNILYSCKSKDKSTVSFSTSTNGLKYRKVPKKQSLSTVLDSSVRNQNNVDALYRLTESFSNVIVNSNSKTSTQKIIVEDDTASSNKQRYRSTRSTRSTKRTLTPLERTMKSNKRDSLISRDKDINLQLEQIQVNGKVTKSELDKLLMEKESILSEIRFLNSDLGISRNNVGNTIIGNTLDLIPFGRNFQNLWQGKTFFNGESSLVTSNVKKGVSDAQTTFRNSFIKSSDDDYETIASPMMNISTTLSGNKFSINYDVVILDKVNSGKISMNASIFNEICDSYSLNSDISSVSNLLITVLVLVKSFNNVNGDSDLPEEPEYIKFNQHNNFEPNVLCANVYSILDKSKDMNESVSKMVKDCIDMKTLSSITSSYSPESFASYIKTLSKKSN
jgi:hypothetical protein